MKLTTIATALIGVSAVVAVPVPADNQARSTSISTASIVQLALLKIDEAFGPLEGLPQEYQATIQTSKSTLQQGVQAIASAYGK